MCPCSVEGLKGACMSFNMDELVRLVSFLLAERSRRTGSFSRGSQGLTARPKQRRRCTASGLGYRRNLDLQRQPLVALD